jgi:hypothetical protein
MFEAELINKHRPGSLHLLPRLRSSQRMVALSCGVSRAAVT